MHLTYTHVDVFSRTPFGGNSLPVFPDCTLDADQMLRITKELRHFEAIFCEPIARRSVRARIFDLFNELPFAGHPIIGAAAVLHRRSGASEAQTWKFELASKTVEVTTECTPDGYSGWLDQGAPEFLGVATDSDRIAGAFNLAREDLDADLPMEVVSTGLRYLIVPVRSGALARASIDRDITELVHSAGAEFAVLLDESAVEVRHWNNDGIIEDIATGSAAGTIGAYRLRHGLARPGETFLVRQGQFTGRPSELWVRPDGSASQVDTVHVGGDVAVVGHGVIEATP
jgi:trans-2,3-dihydro-3-hydroxyanthranilate isomerase